MKRDPFKIDGPTCISFSGGRSSAYMLWRVLQSNGGLPSDAHIVFANTGKEEESSLEFVRDCSVNWGVPIQWVEYQRSSSDVGSVLDFPSWRYVTFATANRNGRPFEQLIESRNFLPNPVARFCTVELKILPAIGAMRGFGYEEHDNLIGMRADEPDRVAKVRASPSGGKRGIERRVPLADAGVSNQDVLAFWRAQSFDLRLPVINGKTMHGNCDLCFLKPPAQRLSLIAEKPSRAVWWIAREVSIGARFTKDGPSYAQIAVFAHDQRDAFDPDEGAIPCFCGD